LSEKRGSPCLYQKEHEAYLKTRARRENMGEDLEEGLSLRVTWERNGHLSFLGAGCLGEKKGSGGMKKRCIGEGITRNDKNHR